MKASPGLVITIALALGAALPAGSQALISVERQDRKVTAASVFAPMASACRGVAIISPGAGGSEAGYRYLGGFMSSLGYLTLVVGHQESGGQALREQVLRHGVREGLANLITDPQAYRGRLMDIEASRQWARARCDADEALLIGHSMGAATVMMEAGARNKLGFQGAGSFSAYAALSPQGVGSIFPEQAWAGIGRPTLLLTGTRDIELGATSWASRAEPFKNLPPGCKRLGVIDGATHMNFAGIGPSREVETLTTQVINAFLDGLRRGDCRAPKPVSGLELSTK